MCIRDSLAGLLEKHLVHAGLGIRPVNVKTIAVDALHILIQPGAGLVLSPAHQYGILIVRAARRPHDHLLALPADMLRHAWADPDAELVFGPNIADWPEQVP